MTTISLDARIVSSPDIMSGEPRVEGRRIRVKDIVLWYEYLGMSADEISFTYDIELADVFSALAYYHAHGDVLRARWGAQEKNGRGIEGYYSVKTSIGQNPIPWQRLNFTWTNTFPKQWQPVSGGAG